jgi:predicted permease
MPPLLTAMYLAAAIFATIAGVVFLIACDNIAILTVVRSAARRREVAIRIALGARPVRVVRQFLAETLSVCVPGAAAGLLLAWLIAAWLERMYAPTPMPFALTFPFDWRVALFATGITIAATLLCGLAPALQTLREDVVASLHAAAGATRAGVRSALIVTQATLSTALLVAAVTLAQSLARSADGDRGFVSDDVLLSTINTGPRGYGEAERAALFERLLDRLERAPDVSSAAVVDNIPVSNNALPLFEVVTLADSGRRVQTPLVSRGFFQTLGIPLRAGRDFTSRDATRPVGIVNETLARMLAPDSTPVGLQLRRADGSLIEIVGVARDSQHSGQQEPEPLLYRPLGQSPPVAATFFIKARGDAAAVFAAIRRMVAEIDPDLVPYNLMTFDDRLALSTIVNRAAATVSGSLGVLVLALGAIGIFGAVSLLVQQRRRELGVRLALGAAPRQLLGMVLGQGLKWTAPGLALGLTFGALATFGLSRALRGIAVLDPVAFLVTPVLLAAVTALACLVPARRASRVDPLVTLRAD